MGAMSRTFTIPLAPQPHPVVGLHPGTEAEDGAAETTDRGDDEYFELTLHEPALTSDNLGFKTWASSYLLAKRLLDLRPMLPNMSSTESALELGAGTGLVGMAAAVILKAHVYLTDLPEIVPNLERNILANTPVLSGAMDGAQDAEACVLDWCDPASFVLKVGDAACPAHSFPLILAADPIYSSDHPKLLVDSIDVHLSRSQRARVVVEMPLRDAYSSERKDFRDRMVGLGLTVLEEGEEVGYDDWAEGCDEEELAEVRCCWSVWRWE